MKKKWSILLAGLLLTAVLTGCAGGTTEASKKASADSAVSDSSTQKSGQEASSGESGTSAASKEESKNSTSKSESKENVSKDEKSGTEQVSGQSGGSSESGEGSGAEPEESGEVIEIDPDASGGEVYIDPETGELVFNPEGGEVIMEEDNSSPFMELSYNAFSVSGGGLSTAKLPAYHIMTSPQEVESFLSSNKSVYALDQAMVGGEDNKRSFTEYAATYNEEFFTSQDLIFVIVSCSAGGENDLGDVIVGEDGSVTVEVWGESPKSAEDTAYMCYSIAYPKDAMKGKKVTVRLVNLAQGEEE